MYLEDFRKELLKTLKAINDEKKNNPDRVFFDIINEKIVHLLTYFSKDYDNNDIESMYTVFDYYITALKHVFFPLKKITNMYKFYGVFKRLIDDNIYQSSEIRFLLQDICKLEIQNIPEKPMLDVGVIVTLYYRKIISKKGFESSIHDFVLEELRKGNNQILSSVGSSPLLTSSPTSPLLTSSSRSSSLPLPLQLPSPPPDTPSPISHVDSPNSFIDSPMLSIVSLESDHSVSSASTGDTRRRGRLTPTRRRIVVTPSAPSRRRAHENIVFGRSLGSASSGSASSGSASSGSASSGSRSSGSASSGSRSSGSASSRRRTSGRAGIRRTTRRRRGQSRETARSNY